MVGLYEAALRSDQKTREIIPGFLVAGLVLKNQTCPSPIPNAQPFRFHIFEQGRFINNIITRTIEKPEGPLSAYGPEGYFRPLI
ncbi:MAG: hypothetical protein JXR70_02745 [Spirochaetales bacterium]|nr:hypothetical protein [Spirochaetales bacterium]